ncbi:N-acetylmuramoyl-L-alanine amidase [Compostibacter hankyongensis]|uniref:N-acetylmuramoyl-L-alanine amidase n=2 Tax=Compostibacter hankyongensis TaxID=1007089 RepID=A0ABP8G3U9_9BACT
MSSGYGDFVPVQLPLDSLSVSSILAPSSNFDIRTPDLVILHHTAQDGCMQSLKTLTNPAVRGRVSSHYLVCKDGTVYQLVNEQYRAWHAGVSSWGNIANVNSASIGIELDNNGHEPFGEKQIAALLVILHSLKERYHIPVANFVGHGDVAPGRKVDPSGFFPWKKLADNGYGYWQDSVLVAPSEDFDYKAALRVIGYNLRDTTAAILAFKRHFIPADTTAALSPENKQVLYDIEQKYLTH